MRPITPRMSPIPRVVLSGWSLAVAIVVSFLGTPGCQLLTDQDADGYDDIAKGGDDCDDGDAQIHPDMNEVCGNGEDEDCDGKDLACDGVDWDGDGLTPADGDCDDEDPQVFLAALELEDGKDNDCDRAIDEGLDTTDDDGDAFSEVQGDCDDGNPAFYPGAPEPCALGQDRNCDGLVPGCPPEDRDGDGYDEEEDCDDADNNAYPGAPERHDERDNDCDGQIDESLPTFDDDGDGYSESEGDCDDTNSEVHPNTTEVCGNGMDDDCRAGDMDCDARDLDEDGYSALQGDCDDGDESLNPGAEERCNGLDDDCDFVVDEGLSSQNYYYDTDGDGFGSEGVVRAFCDAPTQDGEGTWTLNDLDCDDDDSAIHPEAEELCDQLDNDCDGLVDEALNQFWYPDADEDGFGRQDGRVEGCYSLLSQEQAWSQFPGDCDDSDPNQHPEAREFCNWDDTNCDGVVDKAYSWDGWNYIGRIYWYLDDDGDGFGGRDTNYVLRCFPDPSNVGGSYGYENDDADDGDPSIHPGVPDVPGNGLDENAYPTNTSGSGDAKWVEAIGLYKETWLRSSEGQVWVIGTEACVDEVGCPDEQVTIDYQETLWDVGQLSGRSHIALASHVKEGVWEQNWSDRTPCEDVLSPALKVGAYGVESLSVGDFHVLYLNSDGDIHGWGLNSSSQLVDSGEGSVCGITRFNLGEGLPPTVAVSAGTNHSMALLESGAVMAWGGNSSGWLATGSSADSAPPGLVQGLPSPAESIVAGEYMSMALLDDGRTFAWGLGYTGIPGRDSSVPQPPTEVPSLQGIQQAVAGSSHGLALAADGTVLAWGYNGRGQLGTGGTETSEAPVTVPGLRNVVHVAAGPDHSLAIDAFGQVWTWGSNYAGQTGHPMKDMKLHPVPLPLALPPISLLEAGSKHALASGPDGVVGWGANNVGQLCSSPQASAILPTSVGIEGLNQPSQLAAGSDFSLILSEGVAYACGDNSAGQLGQGETVTLVGPQTIALRLGSFSKIAAGGQHALALNQSGALYAWGSNEHGQAASGPEILIQSSPTRVEFDLDVDEVAAGAQHSLALAGGQLYAWGAGNRGQLGLGSLEDSNMLLQVAGFGGLELQQISAGDDHSMALDSSGGCWVWGGNDAGQVDPSAETNVVSPRPCPLDLVDGAVVQAISAGGRFSTAAVMEDGELRLYAWGDNSRCQLSVVDWDGRCLDQPGRVTSLPRLLDNATGGSRSLDRISAGGAYVLALDETGAIHAWGNNQDLELGQRGLDFLTRPTLLQLPDVQ